MKVPAVLAAAIIAALDGSAPLAGQVQTVALPAERIPMARGVTIVQAVSDPGRGDYEATLRLAPATAEGVRIEATAFVDDDRGVHRWLTIGRLVRPDDLRGARREILGFHTNDPQVIEGTTAIGPSLAVVRELAGDGYADHPILNKATSAPLNITFRRVSTEQFPLLVNGRRVAVPALLVRGPIGGADRSMLLHILDHPVHPITLKVVCCVGPPGAPAAEQFMKQVVRIDFAEPTATSTVTQRLTDDCRATVPGIYFESNSDVLNPASSTALAQIAELLRQHATWRLEIEGHTDNLGGADYNLDLSTRRAESVKRALMTGYAIVASRLTTRGHGLTRPVESNDTLEGRAMNRRVEIVRPC